MRHGIPDFLWQIGTEVENLIQRHDALEHWREHVRNWAAEDTPSTDLVGILYSRSLNAKYALLAAIHDTCFAPDQVPPINPWPEDAPLPVMREAIDYIMLRHELLPNANTGTTGLDASELGRLRIILNDVARSLPESGKGAPGRVQRFGSADDARAWLESHVRPIIESLHACQIEWHGSAAVNTNLVIPTAPLPGLAGTPNVADQLSLIRQHINVVRAWALHKGLSDVPGAPPEFADREEAQAAFSEWCAYLDRVAKPVSSSSVDSFVWLCEEAMKRFQSADPNRGSPMTYEFCEAVVKCSKDLELADPPFRWHTLLREEMGQKPDGGLFDWQNHPRAVQASVLDTCTPWGEYSGHLMSIWEETDEVSPEGHRVLREVVPSHQRQKGHAAAVAALKSWIDYYRGPLGQNAPDAGPQVGAGSGASRPALAAKKCTILFLAANPQGMDRLALDEESREIHQKIRASQYRDSLELVTKWAVRPDDLLQYFNEFKPHVVHFSGHGSDSEEIVLTDSDRCPMPVSTEAIKHLFSTLKDNIRVVVLNACYSRAQAEAITEVIDCAIGMKRAIGDKAAITFSASFYRAIGFGRSVQEAFEQGRAALLLEDIPEQDTPGLLTRSGIDPKTIFLVASTPG